MSVWHSEALNSLFLMRDASNEKSVSESNLNEIDYFLSLMESSEENYYLR
jgi:hypothetical protein